MIPYDPEAYDLLHQGAIALAEVESNGIVVDVDYINRSLERAKRRVEKKIAKLETSDVMSVWKSTYGKKTNINSNEQLGKVLFDVMGFPPPEHTQGGGYATDEDALRTVDHSFVSDYLEIKKLQKAVGTNLKGILREVVDGMVHCFFNLHTAKTFRSSSESFNFQNIPVRDPETAQLIRRAFIARPGRQLVEIDISGAEVRVSACYNKDPRLIEYILDKTKDMHRDMAIQLFRLPEKRMVEAHAKSEKWAKEIRHRAKNMFVFPEFYGDWYIDCAKSLWAEVPKLSWDGAPLLKHLESVGLSERGACDPDEEVVRGTFEEHVQKVERDFWEKRFPVYTQWKLNWFKAYQKKGWFKTLTGFICQGEMRKNEVINYPVQGSAFHCLLWSLIRLVRKELAKRKMGTVIVGQIHDSIVADVVPSELDDYLALCRTIMVTKLARHWPWLIVPMEIEAEVAPVGGSWADKKGYEIK